MEDYTNNVETNEVEEMEIEEMSQDGERNAMSTAKKVIIGTALLAFGGFTAYGVYSASKKLREKVEAARAKHMTLPKGEVLDAESEDQKVEADED